MASITNDIPVYDGDKIYINQVVRIQQTVELNTGSAWVATNDDAFQFVVTSPSGTTTTLTLSDSNVTTLGTGIYQLAQDFNERGLWRIRSEAPTLGASTEKVYPVYTYQD